MQNCVHFRDIKTPSWMSLKHLDRWNSLGALLTHAVLDPQSNADVSLPLFPLSLSNQSSIPELVLGACPDPL